MRLRISENVVGLKLDEFGGGMIGKIYIIYIPSNRWCCTYVNVHDTVWASLAI